MRRDPGRPEGEVEREIEASTCTTLKEPIMERAVVRLQGSATFAAIWATTRKTFKT
jgi:hypothetical protein